MTIMHIFCEFFDLFIPSKRKLFFHCANISFVQLLKPVRNHFNKNANAKDLLKRVKVLFLFCIVL